MTSSPKTNDTATALPGDTADNLENPGNITKASRRDSVAVHKKHLAKDKTTDAGAPAGVSVEKFD